MTPFEYNVKDASETIYRAYRAIDLLGSEEGLSDKEKQLDLLFTATTLREAARKVDALITGVGDENC